MADMTAVRATITKIPDEYSVTVVIRESGRSRLFIDRTVASVFEAEAAAEAFTAQHQIPWHTVEVLCSIGSSRALPQANIKSVVA